VSKILRGSRSLRIVIFVLVGSWISTACATLQPAGKHALQPYTPSFPVKASEPPRGEFIRAGSAWIGRNPLHDYEMRVDSGSVALLSSKGEPRLRATGFMPEGADVRADPKGELGWYLNERQIGRARYDVRGLFVELEVSPKVFEQGSPGFTMKLDGSNPDHRDQGTIWFARDKGADRVTVESFRGQDGSRIPFSMETSKGRLGLVLQQDLDRRLLPLMIRLRFDEAEGTATSTPTPEVDKPDWRRAGAGTLPRALHWHAEVCARDGQGGILEKRPDADDSWDLGDRR